MKVNIRGRHIRVTPEIELQVEERFNKLDRFFAGIQRADVVVALDGHGHQKTCNVEATVTLGQGAQLIGKGQSGDMEAAIEVARGKLEKQVRRFHARLKTRRDRTRIGQGNSAPAPEEEVTYEEIVREMLEEGEE